jgi:hypothetical protein
MTIAASSDAALRIIQSAPTDIVADYVTAAVDPSTVGRLISPEALEDIRNVTGRLPGAITDFFGFERELGTDRARADLGICCRISHGSREVLSGRKQGWDPLSTFQEQAIWRRIGMFCKEWGNPASPLYEAVHNLWFEFDIDGSRPPAPIPSIFIGSYQLQSSAAEGGLQGMPREWAWLTNLALPILLGAEIKPAVGRQASRCVNFLPLKVRVFQVGLMLARDSQAMRLCMRGIAMSQIAEYLKALEWEGDCIELENLLDSLEDRVERIDLAVDITDHVLSKIGLECYLGATEAQLLAFLDHLISHRLCTSVEAEALSMWPGIVDEAMLPEAWPKDLLAASRELGGRLRSAFVRKLHHVKLDYRTAAPLRAKAYLGVHHKWLAVETGQEYVNGSNSF